MGEIQIIKFHLYVLFFCYLVIIMTTKTITLTFEIPEFIDKNKFKKELENFIKKKILEEKFYKLMESVDVEKIEEEYEEFRRKFKLRNFD